MYMYNYVLSLVTLLVKRQLMLLLSKTMKKLTYQIKQRPL